MSLAAVLHLVIISMAAFGLFEKKIRGMSAVSLYQLFLLAFYFIGIYFQKIEITPIADLYYISSAILPMFYRDISSRQSLYVYMGHTYLIISNLVGLPIETTALVFSILYMVFSIKEKSISGLLLTVLSVAALLLPSFYNVAKEVLLSVSMIALPYNFHFYKKGYSSIRYINLILLITFSMISPELNGIMKIVMTCYLLSFCLLGAKNRIYEKCWVFILVFILSYKALLAQNFLPIFLTYLASFKFLHLFFHELSQIEFKKGAMEVRYSNLIFLLVSLFLLSGFAYSPFSVNFAGIRENGIYLFAVIWVILIIRDILEEKDPLADREQVFILPAFFFLPVLILISFGDLRVIENNFYFSTIIIIISLLITLKKKREDLFKVLTDWNNRMKFYPVEKGVKKYKPLNNATIQKAPLQGASKIRFDLNLTYPVSVGLLFLGWFLVILEHLKK